ncbi:MAG: hypothetical protein LBR99_02205, partial [Treponema sp.]|nr:hypothetical protein [Treponema sp.]
MEELLDSFFPILLIIAVVALRIVSMVRRKRKREQKTDRGFNPWANNPPASPAAAVLHTKQAPNQEEEFSAWNLSVDE